MKKIVRKVMFGVEVMKWMRKTGLSFKWRYVHESNELFAHWMVIDKKENKWYELFATEYFNNAIEENSISISLAEVKKIDKNTFSKKNFPLFKETIPFYC